MNYAWSADGYAADFGGIAAWGRPGVAARAELHTANLRALRSEGTTVRWWILPELYGDALTWDAAGLPSGVGGTATADIEAALACAERAQVNLLLCWLSFDGFRPARTIGAGAGAVRARSLAPIARAAKARTALVENVVRPLARAAARSPYAHRLLGWDVINEPEWALTPKCRYGGPRFTPSPEVDAISHVEMEALIADVAVGLRQESNAPICVGSASLKWARAWRRLPLDFHQTHVWDWSEESFPYRGGPRAYGLGDRPVLVGELPRRGLKNEPYVVTLERLQRLGYAGALGWATDDPGPAPPPIA